MSANEWGFLEWLFDSILAFFLRLFDGVLKGNKQVDTIEDDDIPW